MIINDFGPSRIRFPPGICMTGDLNDKDISRLIMFVESIVLHKLWKDMARVHAMVKTMQEVGGFPEDRPLEAIVLCLEHAFCWTSDWRQTGRDWQGEPYPYGAAGNFLGWGTKLALRVHRNPT